VKEARRADQQRSPGASLGIHRGNEEERQLREELAVLIRQVLADEATTTLFDAVARADPRLYGLLA
jgi:hypothetical protein